jgi:hypothetical protein
LKNGPEKKNNIRSSSMVISEETMLNSGGRLSARYKPDISKVSLLAIVQETTSVSDESMFELDSSYSQVILYPDGYNVSSPDELDEKRIRQLEM